MEDKIAKEHQLNANEACIYACIAKCTRAGRGWYGNYAALADAMPFEINRTTAFRAVQKLLNLGVIEKRDDEHLYSVQIATESVQNATESVQIATESVQNATESVQNAHESVQNALPPITPLNKRVMDELNKEGKQHSRALCTHDEASQPSNTYEDFKKLFIAVSDITDEGGENWFKYRGVVCEQRWEKLNEMQRVAIIRDLTRCRDQHEKPFKENPYYYLCDFNYPQPQFLDGIEQDNARSQGHVLVQVSYNNRFLICTQTEAERFQLPVIRIW